MGDGKLIRKLLDQTKADAKRIAELEAKLDGEATVRTQVVNSALAVVLDEKAARLKANDVEWQARLDQLRAEHCVEVAELKMRISDERSTAGILRDRIVGLEISVAALQNSLASTETALGEARAANAALKDKIDHLEPRIALLDAKEADLNRLLDKVRDRMKRKEREEESAILNRAALTKTHPGFNRR